ncbi:MAG: hypothetical protein Q8S13_04390, partial [Dehalococcoidia bacterium]|nr:hypothetical protein [Dehalococcoidia bacterium]
MTPSPGQLYRRRRDGRVAVLLTDSGSGYPWYDLAMLDTGRVTYVSDFRLTREWERVRLVSVDVEAWVPKKRPTTC